jgi:hypothetical protein
VWVPCEVKPGPFSDQRIVRVSSASGEWVGFVDTNRLREPIASGSTQATALIVDVTNERFKAQVLGDPLTDSLFEDLVSRVETVGTFQT